MDALTGPQRAKIESLKVEFQADASRGSALVGVLIEQPNEADPLHSEPTYRFGTQLATGTAGSFFSFTGDYQSHRTLLYLKDDEQVVVRLKAAREDSQSLWRLYSEQAGKGTSLIQSLRLPYWQEPYEIPDCAGGTMSLHHRPNWTLTVFAWAWGMTDFRQIGREEASAEEFYRHRKGTLAFLDKVPDASKWIAWSKVDDLWSKSVEFCDWLLTERAADEPLDAVLLKQALLGLNASREVFGRIIPRNIILLYWRRVQELTPAQCHDKWNEVLPI